MSPKDTRSYMYCLKPKDENYKLDPTKDKVLGSLALVWRSYMGDSITLEIGPFTAKA